MIYQRTIAKEVSITGIGIHSGKKVTLKMYPSDADTGVVFKRTDIPSAQAIKADARNVGPTRNNTTLGEGADAIHTVEHLLSALYGLGIDNVYCEMDGPEVPIMDGSSASFVFVLKETGVENLNKTKKFMVITEPVEVEHNGTFARIEPSKNLIIDSTIVFAHPTINTQKEIFEFSCENYIQEISRARTFGMLRDVDMLKRMGLAKGGSLDNAIVLDDYKVINQDGLRFRDEFVRHKILDTIGDVSLLGYELAGKITTYKSGHYLHNVLCRKVLDTPSCFEIVSASSLTQEVREAHRLPQFISVTN
ncbi:MAG: UDP-3-O-[3-hydroxymyristoyl] N-acetylglucosamine deacetylase [Halobacteriovoraceae bacterium]|nr:UDP-3-O-[3-hydroxymyristoyl] N-acetylglucosamine deacetylase [Halobacteriovoraceae bacterium]|tara:strand:+ start:15055 stop:15972 length:918 start_codon:yes stop_codon:yes gene_type:complete